MIIAFARAFLEVQSASWASCEEFEDDLPFIADGGMGDCKEGGSGFGYEFDVFGVDLAGGLGFRGIARSCRG